MIVYKMSSNRLQMLYIAPNKVLKAKHLFKTYRFYHKNLPEPLKSIRQYIPNLCIHVLHMFSTLIE